MLTTTPQNFKLIEKQLAKRQDDFLITDSNNTQSKSFTFTGSLHGKAIIWNTQLSTLQSIARANNVKQYQQFIHIHNERDCYRLEIGLYLKQIDLAAIKRTIIMIRHYKNLRHGRHQYGPIYPF